MKIGVRAHDYGKMEIEKMAETLHREGYEAAQLAKEAEVNEMWLTHYSPSLVKPWLYMDEVTEIFPNAKAGKDGMSVDLRFED